MTDSYRAGMYKSELGTSTTGGLVDLKGYNFHLSGQVDITANIVAAGATAFGTLGATGEIPAGAIIMDSGSCATLAGGSTTGTAGKLNIAKGAANELLLGVAVNTREGNDARPLTYTWFGYVRLIAGTGGITKGAFLVPDTVAAYYGSAIALVPTDSPTNVTITNFLVDLKRSFGKALTTADAGKPFDAFVNFGVL